ncbi:MAG TPA: RNA polymerase sigma factor [Ktedonobacteraceae bacterium]
MFQKQNQVPDNTTLLEHLYQKHARGVLRYIQRYIFSREDADDLLVEVFLAALEHEQIHDLSETSQVAWLLRVARNKIVDYQRKAIRHPVTRLDETLDSPSEIDHLTPEQTALEQEMVDILRNRLALLSELHQQVLRLRFADGLRTGEIAERLQKSDGAIRSLLLRALNLLRHFYIHDGEEQAHE